MLLRRKLEGGNVLPGALSSAGCGGCCPFSGMVGASEDVTHFQLCSRNQDDGHENIPQYISIFIPGLLTRYYSGPCQEVLELLDVLSGFRTCFGAFLGFV